MKINFENLLNNYQIYLGLLEVLPFLGKVFDTEQEKTEFIEASREFIRSRITIENKET